MNSLEKIQQLIQSCDAPNIQLAFQLIKGEGISVDLVMAPWQELIGFFLKEHLIRPEFDPIQRLTTILTRRDVSFWSDNITSLPESIGKLRQLKYFETQQNEIKALPQTFTELVHLESLMLPFNKLEQLPEDIGKLTQLKEIQIQENNISSLPKSIFNLHQLEHFILYDNPIAEPEKETLKYRLPNCTFLM